MDTAKKKGVKSGKSIKEKPLKAAKDVKSTKSLSKKKAQKTPMSGLEGISEEESVGDRNLEPAVSRTTLLIQDYLNFKAAVVLQTSLRGWYYRQLMDKSQQSAIIIQTCWRSFYAKRYYYCLLETTLQKKIEVHYDDSATKIQALWRGYWVREHIHNQQRLMRMQVFAAEDLLYCVAFKLHHLLRTYSIPGVYSLTDSNCLSRVERLLKSMTFKQHNNRMRQAKEKKEKEIAAGKKNFEDNKFQTQVPFGGPSFFGTCEPSCEKLFCEKDADERMHRILREYEDAFNRDPLVEAVKQRKISRKLARRIMLATQMGDFCGDVIKAMKKWKILNEKNMKITREVFRDPKNVENFLSEADSRLAILKDNCCCAIYKQVKICQPELKEICPSPDQHFCD